MWEAADEMSGVQLGGDWPSSALCLDPWVPAAERRSVAAGPLNGRAWIRVTHPRLTPFQLGSGPWTHQIRRALFPVADP